MIQTDRVLHTEKKEERYHKKYEEMKTNVRLNYTLGGRAVRKLLTSLSPRMDETRTKNSREGEVRTRVEGQLTRPVER